MLKLNHAEVEHHNWKKQNSFYFETGLKLHGLKMHIQLFSAVKELFFHNSGCKPAVAQLSDAIYWKKNREEIA